ncbi:hypothetical protein AQUCO_10000010v1 [Aquilegia coerulea]|uniref:Translocon-associated protein subunit beta n=1 Tax=Aquilegia coerulea TaxID=218851 RepID=A0A2G5C447_AQUCA|nr:hypothetical protein AQUCO_10000010v1 [Aquilegia coerulea]
MAISKENFLLVVVALMLISCSTLSLAISDVGPFVVVHKKVSLNRLKSSGSEQVSVSIDIYNQGSATAYDVTLTDDSWTPDVFNLVSGNVTTSWERLDAGSLVSHSFVLESQVKGLFYGAPAVVKFRIPTKAALQAYSTPILPLDILADRAPEKKFEWAKKLLAKYGSLVSVVTIVVLFMYLVASPSKSSAAKGSKKRR